MTDAVDAVLARHRAEERALAVAPDATPAIPAEPEACGRCGRGFRPTGLVTLGYMLDGQRRIIRACWTCMVVDIEALHGWIGERARQDRKRRDLLAMVPPGKCRAQVRRGSDWRPSTEPCGRSAKGTRPLTRWFVMRGPNDPIETEVCGVHMRAAYASRWEPGEDVVEPKPSARSALDRSGIL